MAEHSKNVFARGVLADVSPDELPLFADYAAAANEVKDGAALGSDFGLVESGAIVGPVAVWAAQKVFDRLVEWGGEVATKTIKDFLVDQGKERLKSWLSAPDKSKLDDTLTSQGRQEIINSANQLAGASKLSADDTARTIAAISVQLFGK